MTAEKGEIMSLNFVAEKRAWPPSLPAAPGLLSSSASVVILKNRVKYTEKFLHFIVLNFWFHLLCLVCSSFLDLHFSNALIVSCPFIPVI